MKQEDCEAVAHLITLAWNETYRGIVSDEFLDQLYENEAERARNSLKFFDEDDHQFVLEKGDEIIGYMNLGISEDEASDKCGEIHAIYLLREYQKQRLGRKMIEAGMQELRDMGLKRMLIGCLDHNPANDFYLHIGGKYIRQRIFEKLQLPENVYYFDL